MRDILTVTVLEALNIPPNELSGMRLSTYGSSGLIDTAALIRRIQEYVHMQSLADRLTRLSDLNRRFSKVAKHLNTSVMQIVVELVSSGILTELQRGKHRALVSTAVFKQAIESLTYIDVTEAQYIDKLFSDF